MPAFIKRVSRFGNCVDAWLELLMIHHKLLGAVIVFIGMPLVTLASVGVCTSIIALPMAFLLGWI